MSTEPTLWSSLAEQWQIARRLRGLRIRYDPDRCVGDWACHEVCPLGCWTPDRDRGVAVLRDPESCVACGACALQCPTGAIELR